MRSRRAAGATRVAAAARAWLAAAALLVAPPSRAFPDAPPPGATRAPGEITCANSAVNCHGTVVNDPAGGVRIALTDAATGLPLDAHDAGATYDLDLALSSSRTDRRAWGFELTALDASGDPAGAFVVTGDPTWDVTLDGATGRQYAHHVLAGIAPGSATGTTWRVRWTAPPSGAGDVTFYTCCNAANGNGNNQGDYIGCTTFTSSETAAARELRIDASVTALVGGAARACGPRTQPPMADVVLTACGAPAPECGPAFAVRPVRVLPLVPDPGAPDVVLADESDGGAEPGVLTLYQMDGCDLVLLVRKRLADLLVDAQ